MIGRKSAAGCLPVLACCLQPGSPSTIHYSLSIESHLSKGPHSAPRSIEPSRREAGSACYDNFLHGCTLSGEPLGYKAGPLKALPQLLALLIGAGWEHRGGVGVDLIAFSKGGVVLNQVWAVWM